MEATLLKVILTSSENEIFSNRKVILEYYFPIGEDLIFRRG